MNLRDLYRRLADTSMAQSEVVVPDAVAMPPAGVSGIWEQERRTRAHLIRAVRELAGTGISSGQLTTIASELAEIARHHAGAFSPHGYVLDGPDGPRTPRTRTRPLEI